MYSFTFNDNHFVLPIKGKNTSLITSLVHSYLDTIPIEGIITEVNQLKIKAKLQKAAEEQLSNKTAIQDQQNHTRFFNGEDCFLASTVCSGSQTGFTPTGAGFPDFALNSSDGCLSGEHQSAWYYFEFDANVPPNSTIEFIIDPDDP